MLVIVGFILLIPGVAFSWDAAQGPIDRTGQKDWISWGIVFALAILFLGLSLWCFTHEVAT
jgi:hypothetical protein